MQTIKSSTLGTTTFGHAPEIDPPQSSIPLSIEPEITSSFIGESETVK